MSPHRYLILAGLAAVAFIALLLGMPDYLHSVQAAAAGHPTTRHSPWLTTAFLFGFPAWLWSAVLTYRARRWGWLATVTLASYPGVLAFALTNAARARQDRARVG